MISLRSIVLACLLSLAMAARRRMPSTPIAPLPLPPKDLGKARFAAQYMRLKTLSDEAAKDDLKLPVSRSSRMAFWRG